MQRAFANTPLAITLVEMHEAFALVFISNGIPAAVADDPRFRDANNKVAIYGHNYTHFRRNSVKQIAAASRHILREPSATSYDVERSAQLAKDAQENAWTIKEFWNR